MHSVTERFRRCVLEIRQRHFLYTAARTRAGERERVSEQAPQTDNTNSSSALKSHFRPTVHHVGHKGLKASKFKG